MSRAMLLRTKPYAFSPANCSLARDDLRVARWRDEEPEDNDHADEHQQEAAAC